MFKKIVCCLMLWTCFSLWAQNTEKSLAEAAYIGMEKVIPADETILVKDFTNDYDGKLKKYFLEQVTLSQKYHPLAYERFKELVNQIILQNEPVFAQEDSLFIGYKPARYSLSGDLKRTEKKYLFKKRTRYFFTMQVDELQTGENLLTQTYESEETDQPPLWQYVLVMLTFFFSSFLINAVTKGYYGKYIFLLWIIISLAFSWWYFEALL